MKIVISGIMSLNGEVDGEEKEVELPVEVNFVKSENSEVVISDTSGSSGLVDMTINTEMFRMTIRCESDEIKDALKIMETWHGLS